MTVSLFEAQTAEILDAVREVTSTTLPSASLAPVTAVLVVIGTHATAAVYVAATEDAAANAGVMLRIERLAEDSSHNAVAKVLEQLVADKECHGIALHLPLPDHLYETRLLEVIEGSGKDIDGLSARTVENWANSLALSEVNRTCQHTVSAIIPTVPLACDALLSARLAIQCVTIQPARVLLMGLPQILVASMCCVLTNCGHIVMVSEADSALEESRSQMACADVLIVCTRSDLLVAQWVSSGCILVDLGLSVASSPPSPMVRRRWTGKTQQAIDCVACSDGLARRVAALRLQNACHAALMQQGFLEWETPTLPTACGRPTAAARTGGRGQRTPRNAHVFEFRFDGD
ncbi:hypothetical protein OAO87_02590 [bacterium]|nr:hypothetical protein [bacterium]